MIKKAINNVRRMASHPTLPYCKFYASGPYYCLYRSYSKYFLDRTGFQHDVIVMKMCLEMFPSFFYYVFFTFIV